MHRRKPLCDMGFEPPPRWCDVGYTGLLVEWKGSLALRTDESA